MPTRITKDPADVYDVQADHSAQMALDTDTITSSAWRIPGSLDDEDVPVPGWLQFDGDPADSFTDTTATTWVEGGTAGESYQVVNTIVTEGGRTWERTIHVFVYDR